MIQISIFNISTTNNEHVVNSLFNDFEFFKQVYFRLIDETTKKFKKLDQTNTKYPERYIWKCGAT